MIDLTDIYKDYKNGHRALSNINIKIKKGEFVFLVGASGAGKSTLIKLLLKEEDVTSGRIILDNKDITNLPQKEIPYLRRNMGVVFQDFRLLPNKTVYENVAFAMEIIEETPKSIRRRVPIVLSIVGLSDRAKNYPHQLSGGEQQRVSLARAIANNPQLLICDEPTGNLDPNTSKGIMEQLNDISYRGTTIIMATHDRDTVDKAQKRVITLENGKMISDQEKGGYNYEN